MKKAKEKRALSLRTLTVSMLMVILLAALAVFVSTNASSAVSDSDMLSAKEVSEFGEPKITMTTDERSYNYLEFSVTVSGSDHSQLYIDWGDGNPAEVSSSDIVDVMCSGKVLGNTIKIYSEQTITGFSCTGPLVVSSIDVSKCVDLESLTITNSLLKKIDISKNTKLTTLRCGNNPLTELDTSKNTMLTKLECGYSNLSKLDLTKNTKLEYLGCSYDELTELDLSQNTNLRILDCSSNKLRFADIKVDYSKLISTDIGRQRIVPAKAEPGVTIDLSAEYSINGNITSYEWKSVTTTDNNTSYTTITPTTSANGIFTFGEKFDGKKIFCRMTIMLSDAPNDVVNFTTSYIIIQSPASEDDIQITMTTSKNIGDTFEFKAAYLYHYSGTTEIDGVEEFVEYDEYIPLENIYVDWGDGKIVPVDSKNVGGYDCCYSGELKGNTVKIYTTDSLYDTRQVIEYFKCKNQGLTSIDVLKASALKELCCNGNNLKNLDVSQNTLLTYLDCSENQISELDVSKNINLKFLECYINNIPLLDISKQSNLISIDCGGNPLSELNVFNNTKLQSLLCWETNITDLDISNCTELYSLYCNACRLTSLDVSNNINLEYLACNQNQLTQLDVSNCPKLDIMCVDKNNLTELDISQNTKINVLTISGNKIRFSTLKIDPNNFLFINEELDKEQNPIEIASSIEIGDTIDLSSEYDFYGTKTDYTWYDSDGSEVTPTTSENGVFTFGEEFGGKTVYCTMTNSLCPYMILKTTSVNIPSNKPCEHKNTEIQNAKEATCAEEGYTGDKVCAECKNIMETGTAIPKLTTHKLGDWHYADETSHKRSCSLCDYEETDSHFGGTATYTEQAKCVLCGAGYGELKATAISFNTEALTLIVGDSKTVTACKYPEEREDSITWTSSKESVAAVDANGKVTAVAKGKAVITAKLSNGSSASIQVTVVSQPRRETQSIVINKSAYTLTIKRSKLNPTVSLYASIKGDATGKSWYSDNVNVATVNKSGKVTAVGEGTANIYCRTADGTTSAPCVITVNSFCIESDNMSSNIIYVNAGEKCKVNLNNTSASGEITWKSGSTRYASIDADGNVTALKKGTVTITAIAPDKSKDTCKLVVVAPSDGIKLNKASVSIYEGKTVSLKASLATRGSNDPIFWTSSDESVATVTSKGVVKGIKQGTAIITAYTSNGSYAAATITVMSKAVALEFTEVTPALYMDGNTGKFTVAITSPANSNDTITWSTSNKSVIAIEQISADGKTITIKSGKKGTATITARAGSGKRITYKVTSVNQAADSITLNKYSADIYVGKTVTLKASKIQPRGCNDVVIWESSDEYIATVTPDGVVKGISQGTVTIRANSFGGVQNEVKITVRTRATAINAEAQSDTIAVGESTTVSVTSISPADCNDTLNWSTSSKSIATVEPSADGKSAIVKGLKKGSVTITVKTGSGKYKKIKIIVTQ